jgi:hypothetical protein
LAGKSPGGRADGCGDAPGHLLVKADTENYSFVGMLGGEQPMGIANWEPEVVGHLVGHALGLGEGDGQLLVE